MWLRQMKHRCPNSPFVGVARLDGSKFIVNDRHRPSSRTCTGVATIVQSESDHVWGLVFNLTVDDEETLDDAEGVNHNPPDMSENTSKSPCGTKVARLFVLYMLIQEPKRDDLTKSM